MAIAGVLGLVIAVGAPRVSWSSLLAVRGATSEGAVRWAVIAALGTFAVGMPLSIVQQVYAGYQRAYIANGFAIFGMLAGFGGLVACVRVGTDLPALVIAFGAGSVVSALLGLGYGSSGCRGCGRVAPRCRATPHALSSHAPSRCSCSSSGRSR